MEFLIFFFSFTVFFCLIMCLFSINIIQSVFGLTASFISSSLLLFCLNIFSLAIILILVYVGAIAIIFVFSIMMIDLTKIKKKFFSINSPLIFIILYLLIAFIFFSKYLNWNEKVINFKLNNFNSDLINIGLNLFNKLNLFIIGLGKILLIPLIGILIFI